MHLTKILALIALGVAPAVGVACTIPPVLQRDLDRIPFVATGVVHILSEEQRELPGTGGYAIYGIAELRDARVLRNRSHHRGPIRIRFGMHVEPVCTFGHWLISRKSWYSWLSELPPPSDWHARSSPLRSAS
jgi:hypothetical protein